MKLTKMKKEELEMYTYTDIAEMILSESKNPLNTVDIFKQISILLELSDEQYKNEIGDFYTSLTTDKRFISLENALWDLRDRHAIKIEFNEEEDEEELDDEEEVEEEELDDEDDIDSMDNDLDDDMDDLSIVSDEEMDEN